MVVIEHYKFTKTRHVVQPQGMNVMVKEVVPSSYGKEGGKIKRLCTFVQKQTHTQNMRIFSF